MLTFLRTLFATTALSALGMVAMAAWRGEAEAVLLPLGLALLFGALAVKPALLADHHQDIPDRDPSKLALQLALVVLFLHVVFAL